MEGTPQQPSVPANWYPDPSGEGLRYWDGTAWTTHTAPATPAAPAEQGAPPSSSGAKGAPPTAAAKGAPPGSAGRQSPRPTAVATESDEPTTVEWVLSIALPLVPLAGLIWGIYLRSRGGAKETPGNVAILLSLALILLGVLLLR